MLYGRMTKDMYNVCIDIAAKAFANYDYFSIYVTNDKKRLRFLKSMLGTEFRVNTGLAHFLTANENGKIAAVAMLRDPDYQMTNELQYIKAGFWKTLIQGGYKNVAAWYDMDLKAVKPCQSIGGKTWFLNVLTVVPSMEGQGIGSRMLQECIIPYVKQNGGNKLCLYTNSEINRKFYLKNGFEVFDSQEFSYGGRSVGSWSFEMALNDIN